MGCGVRHGDRVASGREPATGAGALDVSRNRDAFVIGWPEPCLLLPAHVVALFAPAIEAWVVEHRRMGASTKLAEAEPFVVRWRWMAEQHGAGFVTESDASPEASGRRRSPHGYLDVADAADRLHCSTQWVCELLRRHELDGHKVGRSWLVDTASVDAYERRRAA